MNNDKKVSKEAHKTIKRKEKKLANNSLTDKYFNKTVIIFLVIVILLLIFSLKKYSQIYQSITNLNRVYDNIQKENQILKEKISEQKQLLEGIDRKIANYQEERITKEQFTEIYMQLQELTGMISEEKKREFYINRIVKIIGSNNNKLESETIYNIAKTIYEIALKYKFNPFLICALIKVESNFIIDSISDAYAYGLCQVRRFIAKELADNIGIEWDGAEKTLLDPEKNIKIGIHYLAILYNDLGDIKLALTAYNYGPFKVQELISQNNEIPNSYTEKIFQYYAKYRGFEIEEIEEILAKDNS